MSSASATTIQPPHVVEDCRGVLQVYSDGSVVRSLDGNFFIPVRDDGTVEYKDLEYDPLHHLQLRLYRPRNLLPGGPKLPVLFYFHGGGFCIGSPTWPNFHNCCLRLASDLNAILVSPDYRLAPEHRLPAAIHDGVSAVEWLRAQAASPLPDPWLSQDADFSRVFISGESAGGNITHHLALRFSGEASVAPLRIRGFVLLLPMFGGTQLTKSEAAGTDPNAFLTLELTQRYLRLALPVGATADDPLVNPFGPGAPSMEAAELVAMMVVVAGCDLLIDREMEYARRLQGWGKPVEVVEFPGQQHAFSTIDPWAKPVDELISVIKRFIDDKGGCCS